jgi:two-component sensor histidine kinase
LTTQSEAPDEALRRELVHQTRNTLGLISSLLSLQQHRVHDGEALSVLRETTARVRAIAMLYDRRFLSADMASVRFDLYLKESALLFDGSVDNGHPSSVRVTAQAVTLPVRRAVPAALLAQELVISALRAALPADGISLGLLTHDHLGVLVVGPTGGAGPAVALSEVAAALAAQMGGASQVVGRQVRVDFSIAG